MSDDRYLWDKSGPVDQQVARLEHVLGGLGYRERIPDSVARRRLPTGFLVAAALLLAGLALWSLLPGEPEGPGWRVESSGDRLAAAAWWGADKDEVLVLEGIGSVEVAAGSRIQVRELAEHKSLLFLERGRLEADVAAGVAPRFFQVQTPATLCVDLGCHYVLEVADDGTTTVRVTLGEVAFERPDRTAAYVPTGAVCRAAPGRPLGTPCFETGISPRIPLLANKLDRTENPVHRREVISEMLLVANRPRDTLVFWHLLHDPDPEIVAMAEEGLVQVVGWPSGMAAVKRVGPLLPEEWQRYLIDECW